jgi:HK97 family phage prohead protease
MINIENKSIAIPFNFDEIKGIFTGYASVFNQVDLVKDTILKGAYDDEIKTWKEGKAIPINSEHNKKMVFADNLLEAQVDDNGLKVQFQFSEEAKKKYPEEYKSAVLDAQNGKLFMSIGFEVTESHLLDLGLERKEVKKQGMPDKIRKLSLDHIAITNNPVDRKAEMLEVKSLDVNFNESLREIDGKVSAKRFLKENKSLLSNTNAENFVNHIFSLAEGISKKLEASVEPQREEAPAIESKSDDLDSILEQVALKIKS